MKKPLVSGWARYLALSLAALLAFSFLMGCTGDDGAPGASTGTLTGTVTNGASGSGLADATVTTDPAVQGVSITTAADGSYSAKLPAGVYTLTFSKANFTSQTRTVSILAAKSSTVDVTLAATSNVAVDAGADVTSAPGATVTVSVTATPVDGSTVTGIQWAQTGSVAVSIVNATSATTDVILPGVEAYKAELYNHLENLDRTIVQGVNPFALEEAGAVELTATVTTTSGTYQDTVAIHADLSGTAQVSTGINTVPTNVPVLLHGKTSLGDWTWTLTGPTGADATSLLDNATVQNPSFTPTASGKYTATVTNTGGFSNSIDIYAGTWVGIITGQDGDGNPTWDSSCNACHGTVAEATNNFPAWALSGHAEIMTQNINDPGGHWSLSCAGCHTVGYNTTGANNGFDDAATAAGWTAPAHGDPDNWADMLTGFPSVAKLANIQCENCHGPQSGSAHASQIGTGNSVLASRTSMSADVCGSCHGEPKRHARFQQWETSGHANYELAIDEGMSTSCARCHSAQGYLIYLTQLAAGNTGSLPGAAITWDAETVHPQTCATCHDPHNPGDTSGDPGTTNATVRVMGSTPMLPSGFAATGVGKGAVCITCHNSRNGERNDVAMPTADDRAPHTAAQGDVLMGKNSYFVTGERSPHSIIGDSCVTCHMELTDPPAELSYNLGGTNHSFAASLNICAECHGTFDGGTLTAVVAELEEELKAAIETALVNHMNAILAADDIVLFPGAANEATIASGSTVTDVEFIETHGRQGMNVTVGGTTYPDVRLGSDTRIGAGPDTLITSANGQLIAKAGWNLFLIEGDGSLGIHNPGFAIEVLETSVAQLSGI
ncbi:MAG: hypothetical protein Kow0025_21820 [Thermodesulfovibrionales bacterium]